MNTNSHNVLIQYLGQMEYLPIWRKMQHFTETRNENTLDEIWFLEHPPVFTQGLAGKPEHILNLKTIPLVQSDRGGQITYHGPGQLIVYFLVDIRRKGFGIRSFVSKIEQAVIDLLAEYSVVGQSNPKAPGVYVGEAKICSLGLRIRRGSSLHGLSLNVDMDVTPFDCINPCGFTDLKMVQLKDFCTPPTLASLATALVPHLCRHLGYIHPNKYIPL
jgi:lipoyl(octanoyl) transferase